MVLHKYERVSMEMSFLDNAWHSVANNTILFKKQCEPQWKEAYVCFCCYSDYLTCFKQSCTVIVNGNSKKIYRIANNPIYLIY